MRGIVFGRRYTTFFTRDHQWIDFNAGERNAKVGITNFAQESLGDIVYADMPVVGKEFEERDVPMSLESVKAVGEIYMPVGGRITEINSMLDDTPEIVNKSPQQDGWLFKFEAFESLQKTDDMLDETEYSEYVSKT